VRGPGAAEPGMTGTAIASTFKIIMITENPDPFRLMVASSFVYEIHTR
jgi:hypothetical protein